MGEVNKNCGAVSGVFVDLEGGRYYKISEYDKMPPFFISLVSGSDHWLFVSTGGGLTAGRVDAESAIFPYYTEDKLADTASSAGNVCRVRLIREGHPEAWHPFSPHSDNPFCTERAIYKNDLGSRLFFEEANSSLGLVYRYGWMFSDRYGVVYSAKITNSGTSDVSINILDGVQNILPYGTSSAVHLTKSNLLDAYKSSELVVNGKMALFTLNAGLTDRAVPSESLRATTAWQSGLEDPLIILSANQTELFSSTGKVVPECRVFGERGAFVLNSKFDLAPGESKEWFIVLDVNKDASDVVALMESLKDGATRGEPLVADIDYTDDLLRRKIAQADGVQYCAEEPVKIGHSANVMFNIMRGGIPAAGYEITLKDWRNFVEKSNRTVFEQYNSFLNSLPESFTVDFLREKADAEGSANLSRLARQYLPLTFSRRHGDPSRPWNKFSIRLRNSDGSPQLAYEGNWRDIFQNWEALAYSFPLYLENYISLFLCAMTPDGYNPLRVSSEGIEWEVPDPNEVWSSHGYWSDHQIVYLHRLLQTYERFYPGRLKELLQRKIFSFADVPYQLAKYEELIKDPRNSVHFDRSAHGAAMKRTASLGTDGKLAEDGEGGIIHVSLAEKLLIPLLAKLANFVPGGGVWMNTQRPEWNDANNALAGYGLSMVTTYQLYGYIIFLQGLFAGESAVELTDDVADWIETTSTILNSFAKQGRCGQPGDTQRKLFMDEIGTSASRYRQKIYQNGISKQIRSIELSSVQKLLSLAKDIIAGTMRANKRLDGLYHSYNVLEFGSASAKVRNLHEMLEGQVAILASGFLESSDAILLLKALRTSSMYREDQRSYILYPAKTPPAFLERNNVPSSVMHEVSLLSAMDKESDFRILTRDINGNFHFNGSFKNASDVHEALREIEADERFKALVQSDREKVVAIFEDTFKHREYTGRSGSMFAYEGVGCIYWHMVSKLLLAVQEVIQRSELKKDPKNTMLIEVYEDIRKGFGFCKTPSEYGAFPYDPYSHTQLRKGAQQPGMTGMVKEHILARLGEVGVEITGGRIILDPHKVTTREFTLCSGDYTYLDVSGIWRVIKMPAQSLAFTLCQVPFVYQKSADNKLLITWREGAVSESAFCELSEDVCKNIFERTGAITLVQVLFSER